MSDFTEGHREIENQVGQRALYSTCWMLRDMRLRKIPQTVPIPRLLTFDYQPTLDTGGW